MENLIASMNMADLLVGLLIAAAFIASIWYIKKNESCHTDCASCHKSCSKRKEGEPDFVTRYRNDQAAARKEAQSKLQDKDEEPK